MHIFRVVNNNFTLHMGKVFTDLVSFITGLHIKHCAGRRAPRSAEGTVRKAAGR